MPKLERQVSIGTIDKFVHRCKQDKPLTVFLDDDLSPGDTVHLMEHMPQPGLTGHHPTGWFIEAQLAEVAPDLSREGAYHLKFRPEATAYGPNRKSRAILRLKV